MTYELPVAPPWGMGQGGRPIIQPPTAFGPDGQQPTVSTLSQEIFLPELYPIPDAKEFNPLGSIGTAIIQTNVTITGTSFDVPPNTFGVIRGLSLYITDMLTTTNVEYSLIIQQQAAQGYSNLRIFPRAAPFVSNGFDTLIRFTGPATIFVVFNNNDGGTYTIGASYSGWFWPQASDARWRTLGR